MYCSLISYVLGNMLSASHFSNVLRGYPFIPMLEVSRVNQTEEKLTHKESQTLSDKEAMTQLNPERLFLKTSAFSSCNTLKSDYLGLNSSSTSN